jgi:hypothetical protein
VPTSEIQYRKKGYRVSLPSALECSALYVGVFFITISILIKGVRGDLQKQTQATSHVSGTLSSVSSLVCLITGGTLSFKKLDSFPMDSFQCLL